MACSAGTSSATSKRGAVRKYVYTYPARKADQGRNRQGKGDIPNRTLNLPLEVLLHRLNPALRGWCAYFRPGVCAVAFPCLSQYTWARVMKWILQAPPDHLERHPPTLSFSAGGGRPRERLTLFNPAKPTPDALPLPGNSDPGPLADRGMSGPPRE